MKNFIERIQEKDAKITKFFEKKELKKLDKLYADLEKEHQDIRTNLKEINYLLDLIEKHELAAIDNPTVKVQDHKNWLDKIKARFETYHFTKANDLSSEDKDYLQKEKSKLLFEKSQLEKQHFHIHQLIAKMDIYLMDARNTICKEITKGHNVADLGQKLLEHFGREIEGEVDYDLGIKTIVKFLKNLFSIDKVKAKELIDILEKSKVIRYEIDNSNIISIPTVNDFSEYTNVDYTPFFGTWFINA